VALSLHKASGRSRLGGTPDDFGYDYFLQRQRGGKNGVERFLVVHPYKRGIGRFKEGI